RVQLLEDAVRIVRGREISTLRFSEIGAISIKPASALFSGTIVFARPDVAGTGSADKERSVNFNGRQQKRFEEIARRVQAQQSAVEAHDESKGMPRDATSAAASADVLMVRVTAAGARVDAAMRGEPGAEIALDRALGVTTDLLEPLVTWSRELASRFGEPDG